MAERIRQPIIKLAKQALSDKVFGHAVRVDDLGKDKYGRTLGIVRLGGERHQLGTRPRRAGVVVSEVCTP